MATGFEDWTQQSFTSSYEEEQQKANVTAAETELTFTAEVKSWRLYNHGSKTMYYALVTGVSTNNFPIPPRAGITEDVPCTKIYLICAAGETTDARAVGLR